MPKNPQNSLPATKSDIQRLDEKIDGLENSLVHKLDKLQNTLDGFVGRVDDLTIENQVGTNQITELGEQVEGHEGRITRLESPRQQ